MIWKSQRALWWAFRWMRSQESKGTSNWTVSHWFCRAGRADYGVWRLPLADSNWPSHRQERRSPDLPVQLRRRNRRLKSLEKDKRMSIMASVALLFWIIALNQNQSDCCIYTWLYQECIEYRKFFSKAARSILKRIKPRQHSLRS